MKKEYLKFSYYKGKGNEAMAVFEAVKSYHGPCEWCGAKRGCYILEKSREAVHVCYDCMEKAPGSFSRKVLVQSSLLDRLSPSVVEKAGKSRECHWCGGKRISGNSAPLGVKDNMLWPLCPACIYNGAFKALAWNPKTKNWHLVEPQNKI